MLCVAREAYLAKSSINLAQKKKHAKVLQYALGERKKDLYHLLLKLILCGQSFY